MNTYALRAGFTLIELMVVVAIISILASIAIPQYQDYSARARLVEAVQLLSSARLTVTEFYITKGSMPQKEEDLALPVFSTPLVETLVYHRVSATQAVLTVTIQKEATGSEADGKKFSWLGSAAKGGLSWRCHPGDNLGNNAVPPRLLPVNCRTVLPKLP
jgi:type IV pilus assembly protein PilA